VDTNKYHELKKADRRHGRMEKEDTPKFLIEDVT